MKGVSSPPLEARGAVYLCRDLQVLHTQRTVLAGSSETEQKLSSACHRPWIWLYKSVA